VLHTPLQVHIVAMELVVVAGACCLVWRAFAS
jgi:hypothetical protein